MVVGRSDLHDVDARNRHTHGDTPNGVEQLTTREAPGFGRTRPGCRSRINDIDVDGEKDGVAVVHRQFERLAEHVVESARNDLTHLERAHSLFRHPIERLGLGPVSAQTDLQESISAAGA